MSFTAESAEELGFVISHCVRNLSAREISRKDGSK